MSEFKRKGDKHRYSFRDAKCIGLTCWGPGLYQHRGATLSGSRNTGSPDSPCCMNRAYHGCPNNIPAFSKELSAERKKDGWKLA
jgi:hypothetical protein